MGVIITLTQVTSPSKMNGSVGVLANQCSLMKFQIHLIGTFFTTCIFVINPTLSPRVESILSMVFFPDYFFCKPRY